MVSRGLMDKASASGAEDSRFESWRGRCSFLFALSGKEASRVQLQLGAVRHSRGMSSSGRIAGDFEGWHAVAQFLNNVDDVANYYDLIRFAALATCTGVAAIWMLSVHVLQSFCHTIRRCRCS